ncbi:MAG: capsule biosynthesis protein [Neisseria sp.]|uniref:capsule biosynthesis protein n=1 Tax=Neisseria sp. TaxID=192066 RepID=UPI0026DD417A|nr:capsule biosynthesis protein [Neisseria sp.]MDO4641343.1 capsule biosynthesis protein [Neisseria sp.]
MQNPTLQSNLEKLSQNKRILLLQSPIGPFFRNLAQWLENKEVEVYKFNFNYGDQVFYSAHIKNTYCYKDHYEHFESYLTTFLQDKKIEAVVCFGDTRPYHVAAKRICDRLHLSFWAFEEGYFRPHFITLEEHGVNAYSRLPRRGNFYLNAYACLKQQKYTAPAAVPDGFWPRAKLAIRYYLSSSLKHSQYPNYQHHRINQLSHYIQLWVLSGIKRANYILNDHSFAKQIESGKFGRFFVLPLQVFNDSQIHVHSDFASVRDFLLHVLDSFAHHAPHDTTLLIKHHPMDRGFIDYRKDIDAFLEKHPQFHRRIYYVHDVPLPVFLRHGIGMVTLNSTSGLSALIHHMPVKVLGRAHYDIPGMTSQQPLAQFWQNPDQPDQALFHAYRMYHLNITQINGSFYSRVNLPEIN